MAYQVFGRRTRDERGFVPHDDEMIQKHPDRERTGPVRGLWFGGGGVWLEFGSTSFALLGWLVWGCLGRWLELVEFGLELVGMMMTRMNA